MIVLFRFEWYYGNTYKRGLHAPLKEGGCGGLCTRSAGMFLFFFFFRPLSVATSWAGLFVKFLKDAIIRL